MCEAIAAASVGWRKPLGDHIGYICYAGPTPGDAQVSVALVEQRMRDMKLIIGLHDPEAILGAASGPVFRPGPEAAWLYAEYRLHDKLTNGVELHSDLVVNFGPIIHGAISCPFCGFNPDDTGTQKEFADFGEQIDRIGTSAVAGNFNTDAVECIKCGRKSGVNDWAEGGSFMIAGSGLGLWNWPWVEDLLSPIRNIMRDVRPDTEIVDGGYKI